MDLSEIIQVFIPQRDGKDWLTGVMAQTIRN